MDALAMNGQSDADTTEVFLSFKNSGSDGKPTRDAALAGEVYSQLIKRGVRVFSSNVSLEQRGISAFKRAIDQALDSASILIAIGTSGDNLDSQWVRYEWDGFLNDILSGAKPQGRVFVLIEGESVRALPRALRQTQVFVNDLGAIERLCSFVANALRQHGQYRAGSKGSGEYAAVLCEPGHQNEVDAHTRISVFISYARADAASADRIRDSLLDHGWRVCDGEKPYLRAGRSPQEQVRERIDQAIEQGIVLLLLSNQTTKSAAALGQIRYALDRSSTSSRSGRIISIMLEEPVATMKSLSPIVRSLIEETRLADFSQGSLALNIAALVASIEDPHTG